MQFGNTVIQSARSARDGDGLHLLSDAQLLGRFLAEREEAAFGAIVERHGPRVLGTCRHVLRSSHDVEDAFQATFLVLARMASTIRQRDSLGHWLHGVAHRISVRAKVQSVRRLSSERQNTKVSAQQTEDDLNRQEIRQVLHEEIDRLPESFRQPVLLCYVEGRTNEDAAKHLGCPSSTLKARLSRAREILRGRLARRGFTLSAMLLLLLLPFPASAGVVPVSLAATTAAAAVHFARKRPRVGASHSRAASLAEQFDTVKVSPLRLFTLMGALSFSLMMATAVWSISSASASDWFSASYSPPDPRIPPSTLQYKLSHSTSAPKGSESCHDLLPK